jgi:site-specific DNA recombinase
MNAINANGGNAKPANRTTRTARTSPRATSRASSTAAAASGYIRVSTDEQTASGLGLADQRARIEAYCGLRGLELISIVEDTGISGGTPLARRQGGARLLQALAGRAATACRPSKRWR